MSQTQRIPLFLTDEHQCSYLPNEMAQTAFIDPTATVSESIYSSLNTQGFRRSGEYYYRPQCKTCVSCKSLRIPVHQFKANRSQKRCLKGNRDIEAKIVTTPDVWLYYELYSQYINARHKDGDMYPPNPNQYESFIGNHSPFARHVEFRLEDKLVMVSVMDQLSNALSAIYTFYDPTLVSRSLGSYAILWQIQLALEQNLPYLYLGFWIEQCEKMRYKSNYKAHQILNDGQWIEGIEVKSDD